jgi:hypothetical protein
MTNKWFFSLALFFSGALILNAQQAESAAPSHATASDQEIIKATEALTAKYQLNADQAKQMYAIQQRKQRNMGEIAPLQSANPAQYRMKLHNVQQGTLASIRRILQTKEQVLLYNSTQAEIRVLRNKKQKELTAQKASQEDIDTALLGIYAE